MSGYPALRALLEDYQATGSISLTEVVEAALTAATEEQLARAAKARGYELVPAERVRELEADLARATEAWRWLATQRGPR